MNFIRLLSLVIMVCAVLGLTVACSRDPVDELEAAGVATFGSEQSAYSEFTGTWSAKIPFYNLGYTYVRDLRKNKTNIKLVDDLSAKVNIDLELEESGDYRIVVSKDALLEAQSSFYSGFVDYLESADSIQLAALDNMTEGQFEEWLSYNGNDYQSFIADELQEISSAFAEQKEKVEDYPVLGSKGYCIVAEGRYKFASHTLFLKPQNSNEKYSGYLTYEITEDGELYISADSRFGYFNEVTFSKKHSEE